MTPERWQQVGQLYQAAVELQPGDRPAFLRQACGEDESLFQEVESLLATEEESEDFLSAGAIDDAAKALAEEQSFSPVGKRLGHYQVHSLLGAGGMSEVYLAQDTKLDRAVALKILPAAFAADRDRMLRFELEARSAAALSHPNIAHIYEISEDQGTNLIAMEFVDGETLRARMKAEDLGLDLALDITIQIASALTAAHAAGITHRDIKPENVMVRTDGLVKVLDFGIAKVTQIEGKEKRDLVETMPGRIVGTAAYMSPEQVRGGLIDRRSDIWSLGVILYEMVARRRPFSGNTLADVIAAVLERQPPPLSDDSSAALEELEWIVTKTLNKDREARYQTAAELVNDLKQLKQYLESNGEQRPSNSEGSNALSGVPGPPRDPQTIGAAPVPTGEAEQTVSPSAGDVVGRKKSSRYALLVFLFILMVAAGFVIYRSLSSNNSAAMPFSEMSISRLTTSGKITHAAISPDGKYVAHVTVDADGNSLWVSHVAAPSSVRVAGPAATEYVSVTFAPDGDSVYYLTLDRDKGDTRSTACPCWAARRAWRLTT